MALYVQYGCGLCVPDGWTNFDGSPTLRVQKMPLVGKMVRKVRFPDNARFGDIIKGLPIADGSADAAYCSHVLEHLSYEDLKVALRNTYRILRPGGVFRLVLPDLRAIAKEYLSMDRPDAAIHFNDVLQLRGRGRKKGLLGRVRDIIGNSHHMWMWDFEALKMELENAGFANVRRAVFGDSSDPMFAKVESQNRWNGALGIECSRP